MALAELLRKADAEPDVDTLREGVRVMTQALMELEVVAQHLAPSATSAAPIDRVGGRRGAFLATPPERASRGYCRWRRAALAGFTVVW